MPYEIRERDGQYCLYKKDTGKIVKGSCHAERTETERMMRAMLANEHMENTTYLKDDFVITKPGQAYRLFPFGKIVKNGKTREITPEYASQFKLPPFHPAVKLGSHEETTPAGGHIIGLEVRADGLYAVPEWNEKGEQALADGAYRYHSPEVVWSDGAIESHVDGSMIRGPLIIGDALLHMPHLGEATALYSVEPITTEDTNMNDNVNIPQSFWDKFIAPLLSREPEKVEVVKTVEPEDYAVTKQQRDDFKAKLDAQEAKQAQSELIGSIVVQLQNKEEYGMNYVELKAAEEAASMMAGMTPDQREWCMRNFKAYIAQIKESNLTAEIGTEGGGTGSDDPKAQFNALVLKISNENKLNYNAAFEVAKIQHADLFKAWAK